MKQTIKLCCEDINSQFLHIEYVLSKVRSYAAINNRLPALPRRVNDIGKCWDRDACKCPYKSYANVSKCNGRTRFAFVVYPSPYTFLRQEKCY